MPIAHEWTAEMARALPDDGQRYEVLDGKLVVTPAPRLRHQEVVAHLWRQLHDFAREHNVGHALMSPADIEFSPRRLVQPDVFVAPLVDGRKPREWHEIKGLLLAVEVLSPSTARIDRTMKRAIYQSEGVHEYWIVDSDARVVERWRATDTRPEILAAELQWTPVAGGPVLVIDLPALFAEALE